MPDKFKSFNLLWIWLRLKHHLSSLFDFMKQCLSFTIDLKLIINANISKVSNHLYHAYMYTRILFILQYPHGVFFLRLESILTIILDCITRLVIKIKASWSAIRLTLMIKWEQSIMHSRYVHVWMSTCFQLDKKNRKVCRKIIALRAF